MGWGVVKVVVGGGMVILVMKAVVYDGGGGGDHAAGTEKDIGTPQASKQAHQLRGPW